MKPLEARSRALIAAARPAEDPESDDRARVRARVLAKLAAAGAAAAVATTTTKVAVAGTSTGVGAGAATAGAGAAAGVTAGAGTASVVGTAAVVGKGAAVVGAGAASTGVLKAAVFGAILGVFTSGAAEIVLPPPTAPLEGTTTSAPATPPHTPIAARPRPGGASADAPATEARSDSPSDTKASASDSPSKNTAAASGGAPSPGPASGSAGAASAGDTGSGAVPAAAGAASVRDELELLKDAQRAIAAGETDRALSLLDSHASRFESGSFKDERLAARAIALCTSGRTAEAKTAAATFLSTAGSSTLAGRVRAACAAVLSAETKK